ncbi:MAG: hypothetical protein IPN97_06185 [Saprospiraceae bacterium]|nr:hypothetical protein [Saprospiraceae bacterium]
MSISNFSNNTYSQLHGSSIQVGKALQEMSFTNHGRGNQDFLKVVLDENKSWSHVSIIQSALKLLYTKTLDQSVQGGSITKAKGGKDLEVYLESSRSSTPIGSFVRMSNTSLYSWSCMLPD